MRVCLCDVYAGLLFYYYYQWARLLGFYFISFLVVFLIVDNVKLTTLKVVIKGDSDDGGGIISITYLMIVYASDFLIVKIFVFFSLLCDQT